MQLQTLVLFTKKNIVFEANNFLSKTGKTDAYFSSI